LRRAKQKCAKIASTGSKNDVVSPASSHDERIQALYFSAPGLVEAMNNEKTDVCIHFLLLHYKFFQPSQRHRVGQFFFNND